MVRQPASVLYNRVAACLKASLQGPVVFRQLLPSLCLQVFFLFGRGSDGVVLGRPGRDLDFSGCGWGNPCHLYCDPVTLIPVLTLLFFSGPFLLKNGQI